MQEQQSTTGRKPSKPFLLYVLASAVLSFPVTGFIYGVSACKDCGPGPGGAIGRVFIGFVEAFITTITLGNPCDNEAGTSSTNLRGYVLIAFACLLFLFFIGWLIRKRRVNH